MVSTLVGIGIKLQVITRTSLILTIRGSIVEATIVILAMQVFSTSTTMATAIRIMVLVFQSVLSKIVIQD